MISRRNSWFSYHAPSDPATAASIYSVALPRCGCRNTLKRVVRGTEYTSASYCERTRPFTSCSLHVCLRTRTRIVLAVQANACSEALVSIKPEHRITAHLSLSQAPRPFAYKRVRGGRNLAFEYRERFERHGGGLVHGGGTGHRVQCKDMHRVQQPEEDALRRTDLRFERWAPGL